MSDNIKRLNLEAQARDISRLIISALPKGVGMALVLYDFGHGGNLAYMSNGDREDMIATLKELIANLEGRQPDATGNA